MRSIDLVIPMVFPSDPEWQRAYNKTMGNPASAVGNVRYRSWQTEELLVRCCLKFMPWLRCIHLLLASESQVQPWMEELKSEKLKRENNGRECSSDFSTSQCFNFSTPEVKLCFHRDFIPAQYLPTFNVNTIEMWLHRIPGLSEYFIYGNDDLFPLSPLEEKDFFRRPTPDPSRNGGENVGCGDSSEARLSPSTGEREEGLLLPCQSLAERPYPTPPNIFHKFVKNGLDMVAADFGAKFVNTWLRTGHSMTPMLRSTVEHVCTVHADRILQSFSLKREPKNFNQYIFPFWQHLSGQYIDHVPPRRYVGPKVATRDVADILRDPNVGIVCLNDNEGIKDWETRAAIVRREISQKLKK